MKKNSRQTYSGRIQIQNISNFAGARKEVGGPLTTFFRHFFFPKRGFMLFGFSYLFCNAQKMSSADLLFVPYFY